MNVLEALLIQSILLPMYVVRILHASYSSRCGKVVCQWVFRSILVTVQC